MSLKYSLNKNRRRWMRKYMREYREGKLRRDVVGLSVNSARRNELKEGHRLDSFKWRLSRLLSPQYDVLFYVQHEPEKCHRKYEIPLYRSSDFPVTDWFWGYCHTGGEIFKVFAFAKFSRRYDQFTVIVVGVLDQAALLENLRQLTGRKYTKNQEIIEMNVQASEQYQKWQELTFSDSGYLQLTPYLYCLPLKWTARKRPDWRDSGLHELLWAWLWRCNRSKWDKFEIRGVNNGPMRGMFSPIFMRVT